MVQRYSEAPLPASAAQFAVRDTIWLRSRSGPAGALVLRILAPGSVL
jgi:hypothetical protein